jgi:methionyl aminopeptidase
MMVLKTPGELELMDEANRIVHRVLARRRDRGRAGRDDHGRARPLAEARDPRFGGGAGVQGLPGYPATLCTSVNDVIVHGIPGGTASPEGDIVGIDCGVVYKGFYGDAAITFAVGRGGDEARGCSR